MASMVRAAVATLFVLVFISQAHAAPQIRIYPSTATTDSMYPLKQGLYGGGDIHGSLYPGMEFLRISSVSGLTFRGTLEIARIDPDGHMVDVKGLIEGTITPRAENVPYIDITTLDDPLHALISGMHGPIISEGLAMNWSGTPSLGDNPGGSNARLVPMSEKSYARLLAGFQQIAEMKASSIREQESSIPIVERRIHDFLSMSDAWLTEKPDAFPAQSLAKMKVLFAEERAITTKGNNINPQQLKFEAIPVSLEIGAIINAYNHYRDARLREDEFKSMMIGAADIFDNSPCLGPTGDQVEHSAAKCIELAGPVEMFRQRSAALRKVIDADRRILDSVDFDMECIADRADNLLRDASRPLPTFCSKNDQEMPAAQATKI